MVSGNTLAAVKHSGSSCLFESRIAAEAVESGSHTTLRVPEGQYDPVYDLPKRCLTISFNRLSFCIGRYFRVWARKGVQNHKERRGNEQLTGRARRLRCRRGSRNRLGKAWGWQSLWDSKTLAALDSPPSQKNRQYTANRRRQSQSS
jgi:hypothetical protein